MKHTAVEYLIDWMGKNQYFIGNDLLQAVEKAKEIEKEQMLDIYINHNQYNDNFLGFDDYYNETFKTK